MISVLIFKRKCGEISLKTQKTKNPGFCTLKICNDCNKIVELNINQNKILEPNIYRR